MKKAFVLPLLLFTITQAALCQWQESRITNTTWLNWGPKLWGNTVYYTSAPTGLGEIYSYDSVNGSRRILGGDGIDRSSLAVWENNLVVDRYVSGHYDLYLYNPLTGETPISTGPGDKRSADIYKSTVVYEDHSGPYIQVKMWSAGVTTTLYPGIFADQTMPKIYGDRVVFQEGYGSDATVCVWNKGGSMQFFDTAGSPVVYGDKVAFWRGPGWGSSFQGLWEWTPSGGVQHVYTHATSGYPYCSDMWGDVAVSSGSYYGNVGSWDPLHGSLRVNQSNLGYASHPSVYGNQVAWVADSNIYLSTLVPEPSGLLALGSLIGAFGLGVRRSRRNRREQP